MAQSGETKNLLKAEELNDAHLVEFADVPIKPKKPSSSKWRLCSRQVVLVTCIVTILWMFLIPLGFGFRLCTRTHSDVSNVTDKIEGTNEVQRATEGAESALPQVTTGLSVERKGEEVDYLNTGVYDHPRPAAKKAGVAPYRDDQDMFTLNSLIVMARKLFDNSMVRYPPDPDYLMLANDEYYDPFFPPNPDLGAWSRRSEVEHKKENHKPKPSKHSHKSHRHGTSEKKLPKPPVHPDGHPTNELQQFLDTQLALLPANASSPVKFWSGNPKNDSRQQKPVNGFLLDLMNPNITHNRLVSSLGGDQYFDAEYPFLPVARDRFIRAVPEGTKKSKRNTIKKVLGEQSEEKRKGNHAVKADSTGWTAEDVAGLLDIASDRQKRDIPYEDKFDQHVKSMQRIEMMKKQNDKLNKKADAASAEKSRLKQLEKDQALMREMFDNMDNSRKKRNADEEDTAQESEQFQDDYNDQNAVSEQFQASSQVQSRNEPYVYSSDSFRQRKKVKKAVSFDSDDLTKKQHDNSKAQWPNQLVDRFKNIVDEEKDGIQAESDDRLDENVQMDTEEDSLAEMDDTGDEDTLADDGVEMDGAADTSDENEDEAQADSAEQEDDTEKMDDSQLDIATSEEKDEMQFTDTAKKDTPQPASDFAMDVEDADDKQQEEKGSGKSKSKNDDSAGDVAKELAKLFDQPPGTSRKRIRSDRRDFPQEDINFLKEVVLGPFMPPMAIAERRALAFPKQSDVKILSSRPSSRPLQFRANAPADTGPSESNVKNFLTLNINIGPDAMIRLNQNNDYGEDETEDLVNNQHQKGIKVNMVRKGKIQKGLAVADINNSRKMAKTKEQKVEGAVIEKKADTEDEEEESDEEDEETEKDVDVDKSSASKPKETKHSHQTGKGRRKRNRAMDGTEFDATYPLSKSGYGREMPSDRRGEVVAIKLGSINGDGSGRAY